MQNQIETEQSAEQMAETIRNFSRDSLAELAARRTRDYEAAHADFAEELGALAREGDALETESKSTAERLASAERVARFRADELIAQGKPEQARERLAQVETTRRELAKIEKRRGEIAERCREIETAKKTELRRGAETFRDASILLLRALETGLASTLSGTGDVLNSAEAQLSLSLYKLDQLTADQGSSEWFVLNKFYRGRG